MKLKLGLAVASVMLLSASCNLFGPTVTAGVVKTTNGGADWQFANKVKDQQTSIGGLSISRIAYDPHKPERVFVSSYNNGVFVSEDGGNSWTRILERFLVYDFALDPNNSDVIYAAGAYADHGRVLVTKDGGKSWVEIYNEASLQNPVRNIAVNPANGQEVVVGLNSGTLIKSTNGGMNWALLESYSDRINDLEWQRGNLYVVVRNSGVFRSTDGGQNFANIILNLLPSSGSSFRELISPAGVASFNRIAVSSGNSDIVYLTTSTGVFRTFTGGAEWTFTPLPVNISSLQALPITLAPTSDNVVYTSVGPTIYKTSDSGSTWQAGNPHSSGIVNAIAVHPQLPQQALAGIYLP